MIAVFVSVEPIIIRFDSNDNRRHADATVLTMTALANATINRNFSDVTRRLADASRLAKALMVVQA